MLYTSVEFFMYVSVVLILYYTVFKKYQWWLLLAADIVFYISFGIKNIIYIVIAAAVTYAGARLIGYEQQTAGKAAEVYKNKTAGTPLNKLSRHTALKNNIRYIQKLTVALTVFINVIIWIVSRHTASPLGIAFYTLQSAGYVIDVYRGSAKAEKNPAKLALFLSFFPQLIQGPVSRWNDLGSQLFSKKDFSGELFQKGILRILWGCFKKLVTADRAMIAVAAISSDYAAYRGIYVLLGMLLYMIALYADFSGGIDIAVGTAQLFGIKLPENFDMPFISKSLSEYWRRWHITLGEWFRDYVFYPLSVSKPVMRISKKLKGCGFKSFGKRLPVYIGFIAVWFLTGLWHGSEAKFIVWGLLNCTIILISDSMKNIWVKADRKLNYKKSFLYKIFAVVRTMFIVSSLQMFDRYESVSAAVYAYLSIFDIKSYASANMEMIYGLGLLAADYIVLAAAVFIMLMVALLSKKSKLIKADFENLYYLRIIAMLLLFFSVIVFGVYGIGYEARDFIYNRY